MSKAHRAAGHIPIRRAGPYVEARGGRELRAAGHLDARLAVHDQLRAAITPVQPLRLPDLQCIRACATSRHLPGSYKCV